MFAVDGVWDVSGASKAPLIIEKMISLRAVGYLAYMQNLCNIRRSRMENYPEQKVYHMMVNHQCSTAVLVRCLAVIRSLMIRCILISWRAFRRVSVSAIVLEITHRVYQIPAALIYM